MSEKKFEECSLANATHVEVNGKMYKLGGNEVVLEYYHSDCIGLRWEYADAFIPEEMFFTLGIKSLFEHKPEPVVFEATFAKYDGNWYPLYALNDVLSYQNNKRAKFKCVQILEDEE